MSDKTEVTITVPKRPKIKIGRLMFLTIEEAEVLLSELAAAIRDYREKYDDE